MSANVGLIYEMSANVGLMQYNFCVGLSFCRPHADNRA